MFNIWATFSSFKSLFFLFLLSPINKLLSAILEKNSTQYFILFVVLVMKYENVKRYCFVSAPPICGGKLYLADLNSMIYIFYNNLKIDSWTDRLYLLTQTW